MILKVEGGGAGRYTIGVSASTNFDDLRSSPTKCFSISLGLGPEDVCQQQNGATSEALKYDQST